MKRLLLIGLIALMILGSAGCSVPIYLQDQSAANFMPLGVYPQSRVYDENVYVLYFRFGETDYLSTDTRLVAESRTGNTERNLIEALIQGPSSDVTELRGVMNHRTKLVSITTNRDYIYVTLSKEFLDAPESEEDHWQQDAKLAAQVYSRRRLAVYSIVNTLTESGNYSRVQIYIDTQNTGTGEKLSRREMGFVGDGQESQPLEALARSPEVVLTPYHTLDLFMQAVSENRYDLAYDLLAKELGGDDQAPALSDFVESMSNSVNRIPDYHVSPDYGVSSSGGSAVLMLDYTIQTKDGVIYNADIPVVLYRENELWKVPYSLLNQYRTSGNNAS